LVNGLPASQKTQAFAYAEAFYYKLRIIITNKYITHLKNWSKTKIQISSNISLNLSRKISAY